MKYTKTNEKIEYFAFGICFVITFFCVLLIKDSLAEFVPNKNIRISILALLSLFLNQYFLFNCLSKCFFKVPCLKNTIPNFNGEWKGRGKSSYGNETDYPVKISIKQTLTEIFINANFNQSKSEAFNCSVLKENNKEKLIYNYFNNPNSTEDLDKHYGTIVLEKITQDRLKGSYFTDREPQTKGDFDLKLISHGTS